MAFVLTCHRETCHRARLAIYRERLATESENGTGHTKKTRSKKMLELKGKYCKDCKIFTNNIDQDALSMIYHFLDHPMFEGARGPWQRRRAASSSYRSTCATDSSSVMARATRTGTRVRLMVQDASCRVPMPRN